MTSIETFTRSVDEKLLRATDASKPSAIKSLFDDLISQLAGKPDFQYGLEYLQEKSKDVVSDDVKKLFTDVNLKDDGEISLATVVLGMSHSLNPLANDIIRRVAEGSIEGDIFKDPLARLSQAAHNIVDLRGTLVEMGINIPDKSDEIHWTKTLLEQIPTVAKFRSTNWTAILELMKEGKGTVSSSLSGATQDLDKLEQLFTGKIGPEANNVPTIREEFRKNRLGLDIANHFEEKNKNWTVHDITEDDIEELSLKEVRGQKPSRNDLNSMKNQIRATVASAKSRPEETKISTTSPSGPKIGAPGTTKGKERMTDKDAFALARNVGGGEGGELFGDLSKIGPLIAEVSGVAGPEVALAIAAAKIAAEEVARRQKEADAMMKQSEEDSRQARDEATKELDNLSLEFAKDGNEELKKRMNSLKEMVTKSSKFDKVGETFQESNELYRNLLDNAMIRSSGSSGVIESYKSNEDLVAAVSGGKALHGISLLVDDYPIAEGTVPVLKRPEYVQMFGVTEPFRAETFKSTKQSEIATFHKTASSGGMTMANSTSSSSSSSTSFKMWGLSTKTSSGKTSAAEVALSKQTSENATAETNAKTSSAYIVEYIKMPMRCFRVPYDGMRLSEDAKRAIRKVYTEREALQFLRTYGSHLPFGMHTLGGVFFRNMSMQTREDCKTLSLFAAAGEQMSIEVGSSRTNTNSGGFSGGIFGPKVGHSSTTSSAVKTGLSSAKAKSVGDGINEKDVESFYTYSVSSFGPNASSPEEFSEAISKNTGTWSIIDRGNLDQIIPIWDLIHDELVVGLNPPAKEKFEGESEGLDRDRIQVIKCIRLLKRVWARQAQQYMQGPSPPVLPELITRAVDDFVAVNESIGEMVDCICSVIIPITTRVQKEIRGDRLKMLKSLKEVVGAAKDAYLEIGEFEFDNWWIKAFIEHGIQRLTIQRLADQSLDANLSFKEFRVEVNEEDLAYADQIKTDVLRKIHSRAARAAKNLSKDAWEELYEEFIPLAKLSKLRNFVSVSDGERTTLIWNLLSDKNTPRMRVSLKTPTETIEVDATKCALVQCPDAITPVQVAAVPPLFNEQSWDLWTFLLANRRVMIDLSPGESHYWISDGTGKDNRIVSEQELLQDGAIIIINHHPVSLSLVDLHVDDKQKMSKILRGGSAIVLNDPNTSDGLVSGLLKYGAETTDGVPMNFEPGNKYTVYYPGKDALCTFAPQIVTAAMKKYMDMRNRGSLIVSISGRRMHEWQTDGKVNSLNGINKENKEYCLDQFWTLVQVDPPEIGGDSYLPDEKCYVIVNRRSRSRIYASVTSRGAHQDFGLVNHDAELYDSQKWQVIKDGDYYTIINVWSDRRLGLAHGKNSNEINLIMASTEEEYYSYNSSDQLDFQQRHQWAIAPWDLINKGARTPEMNVNDSINVPTDTMLILPMPRTRVSNRQTLPDQHVLDRGGIIIYNQYEVSLTISWSSTMQESEIVHYLEPGSRVDLEWPDMAKQEEAAIVIVYKYSLEKKVTLKTGMKYYIYFPKEDLLCQNVPEVITEEDKVDRKNSRPGFLLVRQKRTGDDKLWRLGSWKNKKETYAFNQKYYEYAKNQVWDLEPASYNSYRIVHQASGRNLSMYKYSSNSGPKKDVQLSINTTNGTSTWDSAWSIKMVGNAETPFIYEISSGDGLFLDVGMAPVVVEGGIGGRYDPFYRGQVMSGLVKSACLVNEKSSWMLVPVDKVNDDAYKIVLGLDTTFELQDTNPDERISFKDACQNGRLISALMQLWWSPSVWAESYNGGLTPLHLAVQKKHVDIVRLLLHFNADLFAKDDVGKMPLDYARAENDEEIKNLLNKFGEDVSYYLKHGTFMGTGTLPPDPVPYSATM